MPISRRTRDANHSPPTTDLSLRLPQARVLRALMPEYPDPLIDWPLATRARLSARAGYAGTSGTVTRVLNGLRKGNSSGTAHPGLLTLGLVEMVVLDINGVDEVNYRITAAGIAAYQSHIAAHGDGLPEVKDAAKNTNQRYRR